MKRRLILLLAAVLAALSSVTLPADTAVATPDAPDHYYEWTAYIYCQAHRPGDETLLHAWPYSLAPGILYYVCTSTGFFTQWQWFEGRNMSTGENWLASDYQNCNIVNCEPHGVGT